MTASRARSATFSSRTQALAFVLGHALLPVGALALVLGTFLWGPFVTLGLAAIAGRLLSRVA